MYVTFCCVHGKTIRTKCYLKVAFSLNSWIYNKKGNYTVDCTLPKYIWTRAQMTLPYWTRLVQYGSRLGTCPNMFR